jgi:TolB protein
MEVVSAQPGHQPTFEDGTTMNVSIDSILRRGVGVVALGFASLALLAHGSPLQTAAARHSESDTKIRSRIFIYDLRDGSSHLVYSDDSIWEAPNWSPDGEYLISNHGGAIYKLVLKPDSTAEPEKLNIPADYRCNNDKSLSPDGRQLGFSATPPGGKGSEVFVADADGGHIQQKTSVPPSYFHGWSPDGKTLAFVAQRNGSGQYDVYSIPAVGGTEKQLTANPHHEDGPDYSPDGHWIYINSDRSGKEAIWRFPASGAGQDDARAQMVLSDDLEDWFPHISLDGKKMVYIGYPAGTATHDPRTVPIELKLVPISHDKVGGPGKTLVKAIGGQGTMNVNSWAPDSMRFAYVTFEAMQ